MSKLQDILQIESDELRNFFQKASIEGAGTSQEVADRREPYVASFLRKYFPEPVMVAKGIIISSDGCRSASIDCNLLSPGHPRLIDSNGNISVILADGVDVAIEVKGSLKNKSEITAGLKQGQSVKKLRRNRSGVLAKNRQDYHHQIPFVLFGEGSHSSEHRQLEIIVEHYEREGTPRREQFDLIVVNGEKLIFNVAPNSITTDGDARQLAVVETGRDTLGAFLFLLMNWPKTEMTVGANVLHDYVSWRWTQGRTYHDLNARISQLG